MTLTRREAEARIVALQGLSTYYVPEATAAPGSTYGWVTYRTLGRFLNQDPCRLYQTLCTLAAFGFCEVSSNVARLSPERWAANTTRYSSYLAYYVSNAPASLRGDDSLWPIDPRLCYNPQSIRYEGKSACITSPFTGVYDAAKHRAVCEPPSDLGPLEIIPPWHETSLPDKSLAENLDFLLAPCTKFRAFLAAIYLQTITLPTLTGAVGELLADYLATAPAVVFAPSDALNLPLLTPDATQLLATNFIAPLPPGAPPAFACAAVYPLTFNTLSGGVVILNAGGEAQVQTATGVVGTFAYTLVGPTAGCGFLVALGSALPPGTVLASDPPVAGAPYARTLVHFGAGVPSF